MGCSSTTVRRIPGSANMGATSASSHQSVQRGSVPFTAIGRRNSRNSGAATGVGPVRAGSAASTKTEPATGWSRPERITGRNSPALLWATSVTGLPAGT